jgi:hypothetical protein
MTPIPAALQRVLPMSSKSIATPETLELVTALVRRHDLTETAHAAFREAFPNAPSDMIDTATFHVAVEGAGVAWDWLADIERFLRQPNKGLDYGVTWHLLYHLYNWQQFERLLPDGRAGMLKWVEQAKEFLAENDTAAVAAALKQLEEMLEGGLQPPSFE